MQGSRWFILIAALSGFMGVGIGAMGAHSLPTQLAKQGFDQETISKKIDQCEIGVRYHMYHTLAILALSVVPVSMRPHRRIACILFVAGILLFSGGLYSMVFLDRAGHWSIVPIGGTIWMIAWLVLAAGELFSMKLSHSRSES